MSYLHKPFLSISFIFGLYLFAGSTQASVGWIFENEQLTGATGVEISGSLYNVNFIDDSCINAFDGCDSVDDFTFKTEMDALEAATALLNQVFLNVNTTALLLDSAPMTTFGCEQTLVCNAIIPYFPNIAAGFSNVAWANNWSIESEDSADISAINRTQDLSIPKTSGQDLFVYAKFSSAQPVPLPAAVWLFGSTLVGLAGIAKHKRV